MPSAPASRSAPVLTSKPWEAGSRSKPAGTRGPGGAGQTSSPMLPHLFRTHSSTGPPLLAISVIGAHIFSSLHYALPQVGHLTTGGSIANALAQRVGDLASEVLAPYINEAVCEIDEKYVAMVRPISPVNSIQTT